MQTRQISHIFVKKERNDLLIVKKNAGRHPLAPVLIFKVMFVQRLYGLSNKQAEYQTNEFIEPSIRIL